ncbi:MAG: hypothetical protein V4793_08700 [Paraburkholderia tropica]
MKQVRRALARGALERDADGLIDASMIFQAWRKPNRRTLAKGALAARTDEANRTTTARQKTRQNAISTDCRACCRWRRRCA